MKADQVHIRFAARVALYLHGDYQAVLAYQGFMAYVYLANRSTCAEEHQPCDWPKPARFNEDVLPALQAFYKANQSGELVSELKGTFDLIFSREPASPGQNPKPFQIFNGQRLVPIAEYLKNNPRPDLIDLERRMQWLGAGPYGNRAGDIVLLAKACTQLAIEQRFYFASVTHHAWHGSACEQDSHIPFILAQVGGSGERMRSLRKFGGEAPTELMMTPLLRELLR